jgi:protein TonB
MTVAADTTFGDREPRHIAWWGLSLLVVLAVHAGLALLLLSRQIVSTPASPPPAVLIELAPLPTLAPAQPQPAPAASIPPTIAEPPRSEPEPLLPPEPLLKREPEVKHPPVEPTPAPAPAVTMPAPKPKPQPKPKPKVQPQPKPQPIDHPPPHPTVPAQPAPVLPAAPATPLAAPAPPSASPAATAAARANWQGQLLAWLSQHKRYPREAQEQRQQGTAHLRFVLDRYGRVLSYSLARSSGFAALDEEVVALIQRAQPLPAPPPELSGTRFELVAPVEFSLRGFR